MDVSDLADGKPGRTGMHWWLNDGRDMAARPFPSSREPIDPYTVSLQELSSERGLPLGGSLASLSRELGCIQYGHQNCTPSTLCAEN